jgi:hypothetical protein
MASRDTGPKRDRWAPRASLVRTANAKVSKDTMDAHVASYSRRSLWAVYEIRSLTAHYDIRLLDRWTDLDSALRAARR